MKERITDEDAYPNPEYLIKSIAEQGYSLETALSDLIDNSIFANADKIEILTNAENQPFNLFITDNGNGMDEHELKNNLQFPSNSPECTRKANDLGRFGLGLKTASFSQTRCFTVISRKKGSVIYNARTWDVDYLKKTGKWRIIVNSRDEINYFIKEYKCLSEQHLNNFIDYSPNTIIIWKGLYKFENYLTIENKKEALYNQITKNTNEYLSIVFHRFLCREKNKLQIRLNNILVKSFNPFPFSEIRALEPQRKNLLDDSIKIQGYVLPNKAIKESKDSVSIWTPSNKSLIDMEGIYVYRMDRLILYGGWNGLIKKTPRLQLGRLMVDIGNKSDHIFHLNVAKSQIDIPYELNNAFLRNIVVLRDEAQKEYYNSIVQIFPRKNKSNSELFVKESTNKGIKLLINEDFPLLKDLKIKLPKEQKASLNFILKYCTTMINSIRNIDNIEFVGNESTDNINIEEILISIRRLLDIGYEKEQIKKDILPNLGIKNNIPEEILDILN